MIINCPDCFNTIIGGQDTCFKCGYTLPKEKKKLGFKDFFKSKPHYSANIDDLSSTKKSTEADYSVFNSVDKYKTNENIKYNFNGIYRYDKNGNKKSEVICPRCNSWNCGFYQQEQTKSEYKANLNPFKPFTYVNKKEVTRVLERYTCNNCGKIFD